MELKFRTLCPACGLRLSRLHCWRMGRDRCEHCGVGIRLNRKPSLVFMVFCIAVILPAPAGLLLAGVPWWSGMIALALFSGFLSAVMPYLMTYDRTTQGVQCKGCGYDLHGAASSRCPECGRDINP